MRVRLALILALTLVPLGPSPVLHGAQAEAADLVLINGKIATVDAGFSIQQAAAIRDGRFVVVGTDDEVAPLVGPSTRVVDLNGRTVLPGLIDSHIHALRGGGTWDSELHWERIGSLQQGLDMIRDRVAHSAPGTWVTVVGGFHVGQLAEKRLPTPEELTAISADHPIWVQYLYERVILNKAAVQALGLTASTPKPDDGEIVKDANGEPTGVVTGFSGITGLYTKVPKPTPEQQITSTRNWFRELNRVGLTTIDDAGGAGQSWPDGYAAVNALHDRAELSVRVNWWMQPQAIGREEETIRQFIDTVPLDSGDAMLRPMGIGERPLVAVFDGDGFQPVPPTFTPEGLTRWRNIVQMVADSGWRLQIHTTRDNSAQQLLPTLEEINTTTPFLARRWYFDHLEDVSEDTIARIKELGMGISIQDRTAFWGEDVLRVGGPEVARRAPPIQTELRLGVPLGGGTDATRTATYSPFLSLWWMVTGKTLAGTQIRGPEESPSREQALRIYTMGSAWFSFDEGNLGSIEPGKLADLIVLSDDYFTMPEDKMRDLESVLTIVNGQPVYASGEFQPLEGVRS